MSKYVKEIKILDEFIKTVKFKDYILNKALNCVEHYSEVDFYFNLEQMLLNVLDEFNVNIDDEVLEAVDEYIINNNYFIELIPNEIVEIWGNE